jgi:hypothetical protein
MVGPMLTRVWQELEYRIDVCLPCHPWCTHRTFLIVKKKIQFSCGCEQFY